MLAAARLCQAEEASSMLRIIMCWARAIDSSSNAVQQACVAIGNLLRLQSCQLRTALSRDTISRTGMGSISPMSGSVG